MMAIALSGVPNLAHACETRIDAEIAPACDHPKVEIVAATSEEATAVCAALADIVNYFADARLTFEPAFVLTFREGPTAPDPSSHLHGYFDPKTSTIVMVRDAEDEWWHLNPEQERDTTLHHELTHMAVAMVLRDDFHRLPKAWHEFIAYAVQLVLMPIELRSSILERYKGNDRFDSMTQINRMIFALAEPDWLAVASYNTYINLGGPNFLRKLFHGEVNVTPVYESVIFT